MNYTKYFFLFFLITIGCQSNSNKELHELNKDTLATYQVASKKEIKPIEIQPELQTFDIQVNKQQIIKGKYGTLITIPAFCFGSNVESVTLELIECFSIIDMLNNRLTTLTLEGRLLETEGMIFLSAIDENRNVLKVKNGQIRVEMPTQKIKEGFGLFYGIEQNGLIMWGNSMNDILESRYIEDVDSDKLTLKSDIHEVSKSKDSFTVELVYDSTINYDETKVSINGKEYNYKDYKERVATYNFITSKLGWLNIDKFISIPSSHLEVKISSAYHNADYLIVLKNYNSIFSRSDNLKIDTFDKIVFQRIPDSEPFTIIGLGVHEGELYFHMEDYQDNSVSIDFPVLNSITREEIEQKLMQKFGKDIWNRPLE